MAHASHIDPSRAPHIAVLLFPAVQLLDVSPIDLFSMLTPAYLRDCGLPAALCASGTPLTISYASAQPAGAASQLTAAAQLLTTHALDSAALAPGRLDVLLVPGPPPSYVPSAAETAFLRAHAAAGAYILTVCTGVFAAGHAGILDGASATGPRALLGTLRAQFARAAFVEQRWEVARGGRLWTSGGITNGLDMVAAFVREVYGGPAADVACRMADVGWRAQMYDTGAVRETGFFLWAFVRSFFGGLGKGHGDKDGKSKGA